MNTTDQIAMGALIIACLSFITSIFSVYISRRTSYETTQQLTFPRVKATFSQHQNPDYRASATVLTVTLENFGPTASVLNPKAEVRIAPLFDNERRLKDKHLIAEFQFSDLAVGNKETKEFASEDYAAGKFERLVSHKYPGLLTPIEHDGIRDKTPFYRVVDIVPPLVTAFALYLVVKYMPGVTKAKEQILIEKYLLLPVHMPSDVGGITDVLQEWEMKPY